MLMISKRRRVSVESYGISIWCEAKFFQAVLRLAEFAGVFPVPVPTTAVVHFAISVVVVSIECLAVRCIDLE